MAVMGGMLSTSLGGMAVANVLRRLDNVVKEYSASVANIATAIVCSFLFPEAFQVCAEPPASSGSRLRSIG